MRGRWDDAITEAERALDQSQSGDRALATGMALYQRAELHRVRGDDVQAESDFRKALEAGQDPQPGLALLRLAQGKTEAALVSLRRALSETPVPFLRIRLLPALVEATLALGDVEAASEAVDELTEATALLGSVYARAIAATSAGAVALARGRTQDALPVLRAALADWAQLDAPYDGARCRLLLARACERLGDHETARLELAAARRAFTELGARRELAALDGKLTPLVPAGLTAREVEVLGLVATGASNRDIAARLVLSEKTVARHVANIFGKIGVSTRAAATAFAYEQRLI